MRTRTLRTYVGLMGLVMVLSASAQSDSKKRPDAPSAAPDAKAILRQTGNEGADAQSQHEKAAEEIKQEEKQRILGVLPNFGTSYVSDAVSLTTAQKMSLAFHSAIDPATFAIAGLVAGYHEANNDYGGPGGFGWGPAGYGKRVGAAYLDAFDGAMIGNGILPAIFHQDPRYFRLGHGTTRHRVLYAISTTFICKHDNSGRWEPNYSNVGGNIIAGAISNLYYPSQNSGWDQTIENGMIVSIEGTAGGVFDEFWPDISRKLFHKDPTNGKDAEMRAHDHGAKDAYRKNKKKQPLEPAPK